MWLKTAGDRHEVEEACLRGGFLGMGWGYQRLDTPTEPITWENYRAWALGKWTSREIANVERFRKADGFVWTRTEDGIYHLAQFTDRWEPRVGGRWDTLDLHNIRRARIETIGPENLVPGSVVRRLSRRGDAFTQVHDDIAARYSQLLWAQRTGAAYDWHPAVADILDSLLSPMDVQDLVAAYLQAERGWVLLPSRLSDSTSAYEYVLRDPGDGRSYAVQVKTGDEPIHQSMLSNANDLRWVIFSYRGCYQGAKPEYVEQLNPAWVLTFMTERRQALPPVVEAWTRVAI